MGASGLKRGVHDDHILFRGHTNLVGVRAGIVANRTVVWGDANCILGGGDLADFFKSGLPANDATTRPLPISGWNHAASSEDNLYPLEANDEATGGDRVLCTKVTNEPLGAIRIRLKFESATAETTLSSCLFSTALHDPEPLRAQLEFQTGRQKTEVYGQYAWFVHR